MKFLDLDSPLMRFLDKVADLMWLNILTMVCCIPLFTIGASLTALHYMAIKIVREEECYITRGFFKSFRENFRQSTVIWLILVVVFAVLGGDFYLMMQHGVEINNIHRLFIMAVGVLVLFTAVMVFPMQARFANPIRLTFKNAFTVAVLQFPKTFLMILLPAFPLLLCYLSWRLFPVAFLFGISAPAVVSAMLYNKIFLRMEAQLMEANAPEDVEEGQETESIFSDKLDESITEDTPFQ
ncbi:MAG: YesL family protein [Acetatifactor sp.]|nr:YesL family protein [Acetatifactor sp.]